MDNNNEQGGGCLSFILAIFCIIFLYKVMSSGIKITFTSPHHQQKGIKLNINKRTFNDK